MEPYDLDVVSYQRLKALMEQLEQQPHIKDRLNDATISFEFIVGSCFPNILENIKAEIRNQYTIGYTQGLKEGKHKEEKENSVE